MGQEGKIQEKTKRSLLEQLQQLARATATKGWLEHQQVAQPPWTQGGKGALKVELSFWVNTQKN